MPTQWTLDLSLTKPVDERYRHDVLHALACMFFEQPDDNHDADIKPFTVRLDPPTATGSRLTLTWLRPDPPPTAAVPTALRLGPHQTDVTAFRSTKIPLTVDAPVGNRRVTFDVRSPATFRHNGSDYPLPDPYLTFSGLARRLLATNPASINADHARTLARSIIVHDHDIQTRPFLWHGNPTTGFIGPVTFGIPTTTTPDNRRLFAILNNFAPAAGIGRGTTHGLGAVNVERS